MLRSFRSCNIFHFPQSNDQYPWEPSARSNCQIHPLHPVTEAIPCQKPVSLNEFNEYMIQAIRTTIKVYTQGGLILARSLEHILTVHFLGPHVIGMLRRPTTGRDEWVNNSVATRIETLKALVSAHPDLFCIFDRDNPLCLIGLEQPFTSNHIPMELMTLSQRMFSKSRLSNSTTKAELLLKVALHTWDILKIRDMEGTVHRPWYKSVTISNDVRRRVGREGFRLVKSAYGAFLSFLGRYPNVFEVLRIPKNDLVRLCPEGSKDKNFRILFQELYHSCDGHLGHRSEINPGQPTESLHISNVPEALNAKTFDQYFNEYHPISTRLCIQHNKRYGFVNFNTIEEAIAAKASLETETIWINRIQYARQSGAA